MVRLDSSARIRSNIRQILANGPINFDSLQVELENRDLLLGPDPESRIDDVLESMPHVAVICPHDHPGADAANPNDPTSNGNIDLVVDRLALIDGITWTVPITERDLATDTLAHRSLGLLFMALLREWCHLDGGDFIDVDYEDRGSVDGDEPSERSLELTAFPPGWLAAHGARAGGFLELRLDGTEVSGVGVSSTPPPTAAQIEALLGVVGDSPESSTTCCLLSDAWTDVFLAHRELRGTKLPPLDDWYAAAGLERDRELLAPIGFDFARERMRLRVEDVVTDHRFSNAQTVAYGALAAAWHDWLTHDGDVDDALLKSAAVSIAQLPVALVFIDSECTDDGAELMVAFATALLEQTRGKARAWPAWMIAQSWARLGNTLEFEHWIDRAVEYDPDHPPAIYDQAWFAFDRGEARKAKTLLTRLGGTMAEHDLGILDPILVPRGQTVGRNEPCPCGSGRKFKHCHLGVDEIALTDRLTWLYRKANWWLGFRHRHEAELMAWLRGQYLSMPPGQLLESDPLIVDSILAEGGRFAEWLSERGALLPTDEAMLAGQWALIERSVYEVTDVRLDEGMTLRDVRTGDVIDVIERSGTHGMRIGRYVLVRPLPTGAGTLQLFGGITIVPGTMLKEFIEVLDASPHPAQIMGLVAKGDAPPSLSNRDGNETVFCEDTWLVTDPARVAHTLDDYFAPDEVADHWTWLADAEDDPDQQSVALGGHTVRGTLRLDGDHLVAETSSRERVTELRGLITATIENVTLIDSLESTLDDIHADAAYERHVFGDNEPEAPGTFDVASAPPEIRAAIRAQMDAYEQAWVDESLPALGGVTPRQALDDPTRRDDLFRLLDEMEERDQGLSEESRLMGMRPSRLRELLGI